MTKYYRIEKLMSEKIGLEPESIGRKIFSRTIKACMDASDIDNVDQYIKIIESDTQELEELFDRLIVPETWFFRDRESFNFLRKYLEEIDFSKDSGYKLRILSVPCSTGEEPYSIVMALLGAGLSQENFQIDAIDISKKAIEAARRAVYGKVSFRGEYKKYQEQYFSHIEEGFKLNDEIKVLVNFYPDNFIRPDALIDNKPYHIIFCKNLLIYLTEDARRQVFANLDRLLLPDGVLFVGHSEVLTCLQNGYTSVRHPRSFACRKALQKSEQKTLQIKTKTILNTPQRKKFVIPKIHGEVQSQEPDSSVLITVRSLADRGALKEASDLCEQFLKNNIDNKEAYYLMGLIHQASNHFSKAEDFFQKALYLDPFYYEALVHMGLLYEKKGERTKASIIKERIKRSQEAGNMKLR